MFLFKHIAYVPTANPCQRGTVLLYIYKFLLKCFHILISFIQVSFKGVFLSECYKPCPVVSQLRTSYRVSNINQFFQVSNNFHKDFKSCCAACHALLKTLNFHLYALVSSSSHRVPFSHCCRNAILKISCVYSCLQRGTDNLSLGPQKSALL